jgi:hypothetical protein
MPDINIKEHTVKMSSNNIEYTSDKHNITMCLDEGIHRYAILLTYDDKIFNEKVMTFYVESKHGKTYARLIHLNIPELIQGFGIGKMCLAIFYNMLQMKNISMFSMKFGGGSDSYSYLKHLGFNEQYIQTSRNTRMQSDSVVVGEYKSLGSRYDEWKLDPIPISEYPTDFFNYK